MSNKKKKIYTLAVSWQMYGQIKIEASSFQEAYELAYDDNTPLPEGDYIDASFEVDEEISKILSEAEEEK